MTSSTAAGPGLMAPPDDRDAPAAGMELMRQQPGRVQVVETSGTAVAAREKAAVEARFLVALHRPRNSDQARLRILDACRRPKFAEAARYRKPVGNGKHVQGLSIRFAEEAGRQWGNLDVSAMIVFDDAERRIYRVVGTDLETNWSVEQDVIVEKFVERLQTRDGDEVLSSRTNSRGKTTYRIAASEDALLTKSNAQVSKARRNMILALIPSDVQEEAVEAVIETQKDRDAKDPAGARKRLLDAFWTLGVTPKQIDDLTGRPLDQLNPAELDLLRTTYTAIRDGEAVWADAVDELRSHFRTEPKEAAAADAPTASAARGSESLKAKLEAKITRRKAQLETEKEDQPTPRQVETYRALVGRRVWSPEERQAFEAQLVDATKATIGDMIDDMAAEAKRRAADAPTA